MAEIKMMSEEYRGIEIHFSRVSPGIMPSFKASWGSWRAMEPLPTKEDAFKLAKAVIDDWVVYDRITDPRRLGGVYS